jgi:hypothetical protein
MRTFFSLFVLFAFMALNTGCFEILEEVNLAPDGSGHLKMTINLSESKTNLTNYMNMEEVQGIPVPSKDEIIRDINRIKTALSKSEGMSNVETTYSFENFIFTVSGDFDNTQHLNDGINNVIGALNRTPFEVVKLDNFDFTEKAFRRYFNYPVSLLDYETLPVMHQFMLESAKIVSIYRFQKPIRLFTNDNARLSPSKKAIKLENSVGDVLQGKTTIANSVMF